MTTSFHVTNYGSFSGNLPRDLDGYCHLTAEGWLSAPMDGMTEMTAELAEELAAQAREAVEDADAGLAEWQAAH